MVVLLEVSHISTVELCQSDHRVLGHLPDQGPSPPIAQFDQAASSRKSLPMDGGCVLGDLLMLQKCFGTLPQIYARHSPVSELYGQFL